MMALIGTENPFLLTTQRISLIRNAAVVYKEMQNTVNCNYSINNENCF